MAKQYLDDAHVLEPDLYRCAGCECRADFRHTLGGVFLNASMASACRDQFGNPQKVSRSAAWYKIPTELRYRIEVRSSVAGDRLRTVMSSIIGGGEG